MTDKKTDKSVRVQFPKESTAKDIASAIRKLQDDWAKKHPERAHELYPNVYSETGERIKQEQPNEKQ